MGDYVAVQEREHPNLGWDPCPGSPEGSGELAGLVQRFSTQVGDMAALVAGSKATGSEWMGRAYDSFTDAMGEFAPKLEKVADAFGSASEALSSWADELEGFQQESMEIDAELGERKSELADAQGQVDGWQERLYDEEETTEEINAHIDDLQDAKSQVRDVESKADDLHDRYLERAKHYGSMLDDAGDAAWGGSWWDDVKGFFDGIADWVEDSVIGDIARGLAPLAKVISDFGGWASAGLAAAGGLSLIIPGAQVAAPFLFAGSAIAGGASLGADTVLASSGYGDWSTVGLGLATLGIGKGVSYAGRKVIQNYRNTNRAGQLRHVKGPGGTEKTYPPSLFNAETTMTQGELGWRMMQLKGNQAKWTITGVQLASSVHDGTSGNMAPVDLARNLEYHQDVDPWDLPQDGAYVEVGQ